MDEQNVVYTYTGISISLKKEENSKTLYTCMKFENTVLNETDQLQKNKHCVIPLL